MVDIERPDDGEQMILRTGRFGKSLASPKYPETTFAEPASRNRPAARSRSPTP
jgi:ssDNA-binding Zn-finger/Zn-ribbon topoisomerase 1